MSLSILHEILLESGIDLGMDKHDWLRSIAGRNELWPVMKDGEFVGGVLFIDNTVHIAIKPEWRKRWATKEMLRAYPSWTPQIDVLAPIRKTNTDSIRLAEHLGFEKQEETDTHYIYVKRKHDEHPA